MSMRSILSHISTWAVEASAWAAAAVAFVVLVVVPAVVWPRLFQAAASQPAVWRRAAPVTENR